MPAAHVRIRVAACPRTVAGVVRDAQVAAAAARRAGHLLRAERRLLAAGDEVRIRARLGPGLVLPLRTRVDAVSLGGLASSLVSGPLRDLEHVVTLSRDGATTEIHDEVRWTAPCGVAPPLVRALIERLLMARAQEIPLRVAALSGAPAVVATALVRDGRVLVAQRTRPAALAGRWELPGGRVEPGEAELAAVVRECREELGANVIATGRLSTDLPIDAGVLRIHTARLAPGSPEPTAREHAALRWLGPADLDTVPWVEADRAAVEDLRVHLVAVR